MGRRSVEAGPKALRRTGPAPPRRQPGSRGLPRPDRDLRLCRRGPIGRCRASGWETLCALQYAKIAGATVAAVDLVDDKLKLALEVGADHAIDARDEDP